MENLNFFEREDIKIVNIKELNKKTLVMRTFDCEDCVILIGQDIETNERYLVHMDSF